MHLLQRRSRGCGTTWDPPMRIDPATVMGADKAHLLQPRSSCSCSPTARSCCSSGAWMPCAGIRTLQRGHPPIPGPGGHVGEKGLGFHGFRRTERGPWSPRSWRWNWGDSYGVIRNKSGFIYEIRSRDSGETWERAPGESPIPHRGRPWPNSSKLASGLTLMVWNNPSSPTQQPKHPLVAAVKARTGAGRGDLPDSGRRAAGANQLRATSISSREQTARILVCTSTIRAQLPTCSDLDMPVFDEAWLDQA